MERRGRKPVEFRRGTTRWDHAMISGNASLYRRSIADVRLFRELLGRPIEPHVPAHEADAAARACAVDLAKAIRAGQLDEQLGEVAIRLREHVERKLEVARPGYSTS
jgi:hypothetical protein